MQKHSDKYGNDLTKLARHGKLNPILGREDEIMRCVQILSHETKNNPIIISDTGKERTELVEGYDIHNFLVSYYSIPSTC